MKKNVVGILAGVLLGSLVFSGTALAAAEDFAGEWYLTIMKLGAEEMNIADLGLEATLTINEDGTAKLDLMGEVEEASWSETDGGLVITVDGEDTDAVIEDGTLILSEGEGDELQVMEFTREKPEAKELAPVRTDVNLEDFNGTWNLDAINMGGMRLPADMMGETTTQIVIEDGVITYIAQAESEEEGEDAESADITLEGVFENGVLSVEGTEENGYLSLKLQLHEDGTMTDGYTSPEEEAAQEAEETEEAEEAEDAEDAEDDGFDEDDEDLFDFGSIYSIYVKAE